MSYFKTAEKKSCKIGRAGTDTQEVGNIRFCESSHGSSSHSFEDPLMYTGSLLLLLLLLAL